MCFETAGQCKIQIFKSGDVSIIGVLTQYSDQRLKKNIRPISNSLESISQLVGVTYNWIDPSRGLAPQMGLVAQDVEKIFPEVVKTDSQGFKSVAYQNLIAPVISAINELRNLQLQSDTKYDLMVFANTQLRANAKATDQKINKLEQENAAIKAHLNEIEKALNSKLMHF